MILFRFSNFFPANKRPLYTVESFNLINDSSSEIDNLDIKYNFCSSNKEKCTLESLDRLTITRVLFWNGGREKIDKTDVDDNPITVKISNGNKILKTKLIHSSNKKANLRLNPLTNTILFSFLDTGNGGVIEVVHTGASDEDIILEGYVEDSLFNGEIRKKGDLRVGSIILLPIISYSVVFVMAYLLIKNRERKKNELNLNPNKLFRLFLILYVALFFISSQTYSLSIFYQKNI